MAELGTEPRGRVDAVNHLTALYQKRQFFLTRWSKEKSAEKMVFWAG